ncbi:MAG: ABC transporter permease [Erysipelotrichaceae bacterium]|nr:ABC transporter permease [Erysipelotrichaceae bacterium]
MDVYIVLGAIELGLIFSILSFGLYISFKVLNLPDLTVDGSFVSGLAICGVLTLNNHPSLGLLLSFLIGAIAGVITGIIHTKLKIHAILASILTMTALYSINLRIMNDKPSMFIGDNNLFSYFLNKFIFFGYDFGYILILSIFVFIVMVFIYIFLKTNIGLSLRATGDNEDMVKSSSVNTDLMKILGFALCNGIVGFAGGLYGFYTQNISISVGQGMLVLGLANIIIGETFLKGKKIFVALISVLLGSIVYRIIITYVFRLGLPASDIRLFSAIIVVIAISFPKIKNDFKKRRLK